MLRKEGIVFKNLVKTSPAHLESSAFCLAMYGTLGRVSKPSRGLCSWQISKLHLVCTLACVQCLRLLFLHTIDISFQLQDVACEIALGFRLDRLFPDCSDDTQLFFVLGLAG